MADTWEASAVQLSGLLKQAQGRGLAEAVLARCSPATRAAFENPHVSRWHPGPALAEFSEALVEVAGAATLEAINFEMSRASFGPILRPMLQVTLALTGRSPATLLSRMPASISQAVRGVDCTWTALGPASGVLAFHYPGGISRNAEHSWRGALRFVGELAGATLRVDRVEHVGGRLAFTVSW